MNSSSISTTYMGVNSKFEDVSRGNCVEVMVAMQLKTGSITPIRGIMIVGRTATLISE